MVSHRSAVYSPDSVCHPSRAQSASVIERSNGTEHLEGGSMIAIVVSQSRGVDLLIVARDDRTILGEQASQPDRREALAVGEMVDDLGGAPLAGDRMRGEAVGRKSFQTARHFV